LDAAHPEALKKWQAAGAGEKGEKPQRGEKKCPE